MYTISRFFSNLLSPIFIPSYAVFMALWTSILCFLPLSTRWAVVAVVFAITCIIPSAAIFILYKIGRISDPGLNNRTDRFVPYVITMLSYAAAALYLTRIHAPMWLSMFLVGGTVAASVSLIVNLKWKISAHMAAIGGMVALAFRMSANHVNVFPMEPVIYTTIILAGILGTSRLILERHTLGQVFAGTLNGFLCVYLFTMIN